MNDNFICTPNEKDKGKETPITPGNGDNANGEGNNGKNVDVLKAMMRMFMILFFVIN